MTNEMKLCPFCGGSNPEVSEHRESCFLRLMYDEISEGISIDRQQLQKAWNTRHQPETNTKKENE